VKTARVASEDNTEVHLVLRTISTSYARDHHNHIPAGAGDATVIGPKHSGPTSVA